MNSILLKLKECTAQIEGAAVMNTESAVLCNTMGLDTISIYAEGLSKAFDVARHQSIADIVIQKTEKCTVLVAHINEEELLAVIAKPKTNAAFIGLLMKRTLLELMLFQAKKHGVTPNPPCPYRYATQV